MVATQNSSSPNNYSSIASSSSLTVASVPQNRVPPKINREILPPVNKDNILKIYSKFIAPTNYIFHASVPPVFKEISKWIKLNSANSIDELSALATYLKRCSNLLQKSEIKQFICEKKDFNTWEKYNENTTVALQYIEAFYEMDAEGNLEEEKPLSTAHLIKCFEGAVKLQALEKGETTETPKENDYQLAVSGHSALSPSQRIASVDTAGTFLLTSMMDNAPVGSMVDASMSWPLADPDAHLAASSAAVTLSGGLFMMIGFAFMTSFDTSMEYRLVLQKMLLGDVYARTRTSLKGLSSVTLDAIKEFLLESEQRKQITKNKPAETQAFLTSADKKHLFKQFLGAPLEKLNYTQLVSQFKKIVLEKNEQHQAELLSALSSTVFKYDKKWGTALDHIFANVNKECKQKIIENLKSNKLFGLNISSQEKHLPLKFNESIAYVYNIMRNTPWKDRINGSLVFSKLMFEIYTSEFDGDKKLFLLQMLSDSLQEKETGEFGAGKFRRGNLVRNGFISVGYLAQAALCLAASFIPGSHLVYSLCSTAGGAYGAITFGAFTAAPYYGSTASHESKKSAVQEARAQAFDTGNKDEIQLKYKYFLKLCQDLKTTQDETKREEILSDITTRIKFFEEQGISDFVLESCHGAKTCPLFEIARELLDPKNKKNKVRHDEVYEILQAAYNQKNERDWKDLPESDSEEEKFKIFMTKGLSSVDSAKQKFLFCLRCQAMLSSMKEGESKKNCKEIFENSLKNAEGDKGSLMFNLQKRAEKKYHTKKAIGRIFSNLFASGLGLAVTLLISTFAPHLFLIGVFVCFCLVCVDFVVRKLLERWAYSKNYKYYVVMQKFSCAMPNNAAKVTMPSAKDTLEHISKTYKPADASSFLAALNKGFSDWEREENKKKLGKIKNESDLQRELGLLTQQHIDKENICKSLLTAQWLIFSCDKISNIQKEKILCEQTALYCFHGEIAKVLRTKNMFGQSQYLAVDAFAGGLTALLSLINIIPGVTAFQTTSFADGSSTQSLAQCWHSYVTQSCLDTASFWIWSQYFDVSELGKTTASCQNALGCFKKALFVVRESIKNQPENEKEERSTEVKQFVTDILKSHRTVNPINKMRRTKSSIEYEKLFSLPAASAG